jgi:elongation factor P
VDQVEHAELTHEPYQYSWTDGSNYTFMHVKSFEEIQLTKEDIDDVEFLVEGQEVDVLFYSSNKILGVELPMTFVYDISRIDHSNAISGYHTAILNSGAGVMVPDHLDAGMKIKVHVHDRKFMERVV